MKGLYKKEERVTFTEYFIAPKPCQLAPSLSRRFVSIDACHTTTHITLFSTSLWQWTATTRHYRLHGVSQLARSTRRGSDSSANCVLRSPGLHTATSPSSGTARKVSPRQFQSKSPLQPTNTASSTSRRVSGRGLPGILAAFHRTCI